MWPLLARAGKPAIHSRRGQSLGGLQTYRFWLTVQTAVRSTRTKNVFSCNLRTASSSACSEHSGLILDFSVLEPNDGATISLVYEANEEATPEFSGACLEVAKATVLPPADFYNSISMAAC